jgi:hypothetical protein
MTAPTPGPWQVGVSTETQHDYPYRYIGWSVPIWDASRKHSIAAVFNRRRGPKGLADPAVQNREAIDEARANAHLIAAAPELLDLLHRMHERLTDGRAVPEWMAGWEEEIETAIAKAEGR